MARLEKLLDLFDYDTDQEWEKALFALAEDSGFSRILFGVVPSKTEPLETAFIKSNYPQEWRAIYDKLKFHYIDPVVLHCIDSALPLIWTGRTFKGRVQSEFYEQACSYGLRAGITYPVHGMLGEFGMISFASSDPLGEAYGRQYETLAELSLISDYVLESSKKFQQPHGALAGAIRLTRRELECLKWIMVGKSSWEISKILYCSEATVNFHVANLKKKFNVQTRQQVVVKAIKEHLIEPV